MLMHDLRLAVRWLRANPGFTAAALTALGLGIGASTATFTIVHATALRPLAFHEPDRIIRIWSSPSGRNLPFFSVSAPDFADWRARSRVLAQVAAYDRQKPMTLTDAGEPEQLLAARVGSDLFALLGVAPALGRTFAPDEDAPGAAARPAIVSHALWQRRLGGRADALGRTLRLDGDVWTVVGVMPPRFAIPNNPAEVWLPLQLKIDPARRAERYLRVLGRLRPDATLDQARAELESLATALAVEHPASNRIWTVTVRELTETVVGSDYRRALFILSAAVACVLSIACADVAGLLLSRAAARRREMAVRAALGAGRGALIRQMLAESLVLGAGAGALGLLLAALALDALKLVAADSVPRLDELALRPPVVAFAVALSALTAVLFGIVPALEASRIPAGALRSRDVHDRRATRGRDLLVLGESAVAVMLLVGAGLMLRTLGHLQQRKLGFDPAHLLMVQVPPPPAGAGATGHVRFHDALVERLAALPGVVAAAAVSSAPFAGPNSANGFVVEGATSEGDSIPDTDFRVVTREYFRTLAIPIVRGRAFDDADGPAAPAVIVSASTARRYLSARDPIGARLRFPDGQWMTVVGVAGDVRYRELDDPSDDLRPMMYLPHRALPAVPLTMALRTSAPPESLATAVRAAVASLDPGRPISRLEAMATVLARERGPQRFNALVLSAFAWIALALAAAGLWGLIAYGVTRRTREIAVRVALGAQPADVLRATAGRGMWLASVGLLVGLSGAAALTRVFQRLLFGVSSTDPATFAGIAAVFLAAALGASLLPARRALRIAPAEALRAE